MITHVIYHIPGRKVGCTKDLDKRKSLYKFEDGETPRIEILETLRNKTDREAGDVEWAWADKFGYWRGPHYPDIEERVRTTRRQRVLRATRGGDMTIGFTGTRRGLSPAQMDILRKVLEGSSGSFHHGGCVGADRQAARIASQIGRHVVMHPGPEPQSYFEDVSSLGGVALADEVRPAAPYLKRNRDIAHTTESLVACPGQDHEVLRSGTWATIRYALKITRPVILIYPDGTVTNGKEIQT